MPSDGMRVAVSQKGYEPKELPIPGGAPELGHLRRQPPPVGAPAAPRVPCQTLDALAAYVASLVRAPTSPFDAPAGATDLADARGCTTCHTPGPWTDSTLDQRHDVGTIGPGSGQRRGGTLDGFDTPTLVGTFLTAPYLHDGSAPTVEDAIRAHDPAVTGGSLDADDVAALAALVRSL